MSKLDDARKIIDECDEIIKTAFIKRMEAVKLVAKYKKENKLPILDSKREEQIILNKETELKDNIYKDDYMLLFKEILKISKDYQKRELRDKYCLIGNNLRHSYSKLIHEAIFKENNLDASYDLLEINESELDYFFKNDIFKYKGINITNPYKEKVLKYLDILDESVIKLKNCNTIKVEDNKLVGYNTDYYGFIELLNFYNIDITNKNCFILGTGGAAKTVYHTLIEKAKVVKFVSRSKKDENTISYEDLVNQKIDILINATPNGMNDLVDINPFDRKKVEVAIDLIYNPKQTKFLKFNESHYNGLPMLIYQALKADEIWYSRKLNLDYFRLEGEISE